MYLKLIGDDINDTDLIEKDPDQDDQDYIMENISSADETNQQLEQQPMQPLQPPSQTPQIQIIDKSSSSPANGNIVVDDESDETDLTNLAWLTDLKNLTNLPDIIVGGHGGKGSGAGGNGGGGGGADEEIIEPISDKNLTEIRFNNFMTQVKQ